MAKNKINFETFQDALRHHEIALNSLRKNFQQITEISNVILECFQSGGKVYACGNGGSAGDAQHFVAEIVGRFVLERKGLPAVALTTDTSVITALANDYSYDEIFSRQVEALCTKDDVLVAISTSGNSKNIFNAITAAKENGTQTVFLSGKNGGECKGLADVDFIVKSNNTAAIQEIHIMIIHMICRIIDQHNQVQKVNNS